jgi:septal ring factor EnvC (AmiA/AmiB activator)
VKSWRYLWAALALCSLAHGAEKAGTEADLAKVRRDIAELQQAIRTSTTQRDALAARLRDAELSIAGARRKLDDIRAERVASERQREQLEREKVRSEQTLQGEREALAGQLRAAYVIGREEQVKLLLNQQEPARLGRMFVYYSYFGRSRAEKIATISAELAQLAELGSALDEQTRQLAEIEERARAELAALQNGRRDRNRVLGEFDRKLKSRVASLAKLKREENTLEKLLEDLRRVVSDFPIHSEEPFEKLKGRLTWPLNGRLVADFGQRRAGGVSWNGVLLAAERGAKVRAVYFGRVIYADWLPGMGLLTIVEHSGGYLSLYGHNEQLFKSVGDWVAPGDVIAAAGDSGGRERTELYFEIRKGARPLNPHQWIKKSLPRR